MDSTPKSAFQWGFRTACIALFGLALLAELTVYLVSKAQALPGSERWVYALAFFFLVGMPVLGAIVYKTRLVFGFFRSVKVGVTNLIFIGLSSILGVLFLQEDPYNPMPQDGLDSLVERQQLEEDSAPWTSRERRVYQDFLAFRNAQSYFTYHFFHGLGFHSLPGVDSECSLNLEEIDGKMKVLGRNIAPLRSRFGEDYVVALEAKSGTGLRVRQENAELAGFEKQWGDFWWSTFVWCDRLDFIRVYKSDWFASFWFVLFFGVLSNTFRGGWRRLLKPKKYGFVITHGGVLLMLLAAFWGRLSEIRGSLDINVGQVAGSFRSHVGGERVPFQDKRLSGGGEPFRVQLEAFRADYHDVLEVIYAQPSGTGFVEEFEGLEVPKSRVYEGQVLEFDWVEGAPLLQLEVLEYVPQSELQPKLIPASSADTGHPMAMLELVNPEGAKELEQILFHGFPTPLVHEESGAKVLYQAVGSFGEAQDIARSKDQESFGSPARSRWWVFQLPDSSCYVSQVGESAEVAELGVGRSFPIGGGYSVRLANALLRASLGREIQAIEGADFFHSAPGSIQLRYTTLEKSEKLALSTEGGMQVPRVEYSGPDGVPRVAFLHFHTDQRDMPLEWQSKLSMLERGEDGSWQTTSSGAIRVNDYFYHKGWRFFQSNANPEDPTYSGIGVVYDPALEFVLIGLYMVMFGILVVYVINPLATRKHRGV